MKYITLILKKFEDVLYTLDDFDLGYFFEVDIKFIDKIKQKTKKIPFGPENEISPQDKFID